MKCLIPGSNLKVFGRAIHSLSRIGDELYIESVDQGVVFRTVNSSRSAFASFLFTLSFFDSFISDAPGNDSEEVNDLVKCKISLKSCFNIFKSLSHIEKNVDRCTIELAQDSTKLILRLYCKYGIRKTYHIPFIECESLQAIFSKNDCPNFIVAQSRLLSDIVQNFPINQEEVTLTVAPDRASLKNYVDDEPDPSKVVHTEMILEAEEFDEFDINNPTEITFCLKELRAILTFTDVGNLPIAIHFETSGKPIIFNLQNSLNLESDFVLATMANNPAEHQDSSQEAVGKLTNKKSVKKIIRKKTPKELNANDKSNGHQNTMSKASTSHANNTVNPQVSNEFDEDLPLSPVNQAINKDISDVHKSFDEDAENIQNKISDGDTYNRPSKKMKFMFLGVPEISTEQQLNVTQVLASDTDEDSS